MRSLFAKILLWFLATAVISFFGAVFISALDMNPWQSPFGRLMDVRGAGGAHRLGDRRRAGPGRFRAPFPRQFGHVRGAHRQCRARSADRQGLCGGPEENPITQLSGLAPAQRHHRTPLRRWPV